MLNLYCAQNHRLYCLFVALKTAPITTIGLRQYSVWKRVERGGTLCTVSSDSQSCNGNKWRVDRLHHPWVSIITGTLACKLRAALLPPAPYKQLHILNMIISWTESWIIQKATFWDSEASFQSFSFVDVLNKEIPWSLKWIEMGNRRARLLTEQWIKMQDRWKIHFTPRSLRGGCWDAGNRIHLKLCCSI